ncbi:MAG: formylmethanofuran--tetrahydromethanopterin N-formyltransferase, partial [Planctomycetia bacterium]
YWRVPVMDGEFLCEESFGTVKGVGGGNFLLLGRSQVGTLAAARAAVEAIAAVRDVITPFPGGVVRSGSKVGGKYKKIRASTADAFCPTLRGAVKKTALPEGTNVVYEVVIDGLTQDAVGEAMRVGVHAACAAAGAGELLAVTAGNYGGKLGPFHYKLHALLAEPAAV